MFRTAARKLVAYTIPSGFCTAWSSSTAFAMLKNVPAYISNTCFWMVDDGW